VADAAQASALLCSERMKPKDKHGPLDGSTSGTIGGGGAETGGPTDRPEAPAIPKVKPDDAASGRLSPDTIGAGIEPDELGPGPSDVKSGGR
jgi:hypothetical protein